MGAGAQPGRSAGTHSMPEGGSSAWAAYLASPASSAMSPVPASEQPCQWPSTSQQVTSPPYTSSPPFCPNPEVYICAAAYNGLRGHSVARQGSSLEAGLGHGAIVQAEGVV